MSAQRTLSFGISPCPNDTYIFHALAMRRIPLPCDFDVFMADVEVLNGRARAGSLDVTKLSIAAMAHAAKDYRLLRAGGALGRGCGPLLVARGGLAVEDLTHATVAIPGAMTTGNLLLSLHGGFRGERVEMVFDEVMPAVAAGEVACGVVIHEGRFTYPAFGLDLVLDLGKWWEGTTGMPLPLGSIAIRRDIDDATALAVEDAIRRSLRHAHDDPADSRAFIREHAQELADEVIENHIRTFVNEYSMDLGIEGQKAVHALVLKAAEAAGTTLPDAPLFLEG